MKRVTKLTHIWLAVWLSVFLAAPASLGQSESSDTAPIIEDGTGDDGRGVGDSKVKVPASHVEEVPLEKSHQEAAPEIKMKAGAHAQLTGEVEQSQALGALNAKLGFNVTPDGKDMLPGTVSKIQPDSPLVKRGVVDGDKLIGETKNSDGSVTLTMEHAGQAFRFSLKSNEVLAAIAKDDKPKPLKAAVDTSGHKRIAALSGGVKGKQFKTMIDIMVDHDLGLVVDRSGSMNTDDCPGNMTRWQWCGTEATELGRAAAEASSVIDAAIFNSDYVTYKRIQPQQIPAIFATNTPSGGTEPAYALKEQMENYFASSRAKPLTIVMVTDGLPNHPANIAAVLKEESAKIRYQGEITISVLLISDEVGDDRFRNTCGLTANSSVKDGGFVDIIPFHVLVQKGIERALFDDLKEVRLNTDPRKASRASQTALGVPTDAPNHKDHPNGLRTYAPSYGSLAGPGVVTYPRH